jgi:hypothetical protein
MLIKKVWIYYITYIITLGGLNIAEKNSGAGSVISDFLKQIGKKVNYK